MSIEISIETLERILGRVWIKRNGVESPLLYDGRVYYIDAKREELVYLDGIREEIYLCLEPETVKEMKYRKYRII